MTLKSDAKFENKTGSKNDMKNFLNFNARGGKSESLHFDVFYFCRKYIMFKPKRYGRVMCHNIEQWWKIWRRNDLWFEKWHEEFVKCWPNSPKSQNLQLNGLLLIEVYSVWTKKSQTYWRVLHHYSKDRCKLWRKNDSSFYKSHEEFGEFHWSTQKS